MLVAAWAGFALLLTPPQPLLRSQPKPAPATQASADTASEPKGVIHTWRRIHYGMLDGQLSLLFAEGFERTKPALGDLDGDGDLDLIIGTAEGKLMYFENQGTAKKPDWRLVGEAMTALPAGKSGPGDEVPQVINVGADAAPALVDIDGDGDLDLFVGSASGKLYFYRNVGNKFLAQFRLESVDYLGRSFGQNLAPQFADVTGDGLPDLTLGNESGDVWLLPNVGTRQQARFCAAPEVAPPDCLVPPQKLAHLRTADNAVPVWVDWNQDGALDLMVGKSDGSLDYYQNIGTRTQGAWELKEERFNILNAGGFAAPQFADVNGDGRTDLLLAGDGVRLGLYVSQPRKGDSAGTTNELWVQDENVLHVRSLSGFDSRARVAAGDLFGNGRQDLVVGTASGQLLVYQNLGGKDVPSFRTVNPPILPNPQRAFSVPALVDVNGDGLLDLIVGDRNGRLEFIRNVGSRFTPQWKAAGVFYGGISVGALSTPLFADVDGDGLVDVLVGNSRGQIIYFQNVGTAGAPAYQLVTTRFGGLAVGSAAAPALFQWNKQTPPDLVVGNQSGTLVASIRDPAVPVDQRTAYRPQAAPWVGLRARAYSAPTIADLTGSGRPDLLLGTATGQVLLWHYEGPLNPEQLAKERPRGANVVVDESARGRPEPGENAAAAAAAALPPLPTDPIFVQEPSELEQLPVGRISQPAFFDYNGDGRPDLVVGNNRGQLLLFENLGPPANPHWKLITEQFANFHQGRNAAPCFYDVDGDGDLDLIVGTEEGRLFYFENTGTAKAPRFELRPDVLRSIRVGNNAIPAFLSFGPGTAPALVVGSLKGALSLYRAAGKKPFDYVLEDRRFTGLDMGVNTSPTAADLVLLKQPYLVVGTDRGEILVLAPTGTSPERSSGWRLNTTYLASLAMPPGSHPALVDLDGDGDLDLVVGSDKGPLTFFRNNAINAEVAATSGTR